MRLQLNLNSIALTRAETIASAWYQALVDSGDAPPNGAPSNGGPQPSEQFRIELLKLTRQIITLLTDEQFQVEDARAIGARLALLGFKRVNVLVIAQTILSHELASTGGASTEGASTHSHLELDSSQIEAIYARLGRILIELTTGFMEQHHQVSLLEREQALQAYETEWKRFIADRQEMEQKSQAILRAVPDALSIITIDGDVLYYHAGSEKEFTDDVKVLFKNIREYLPAELAEELPIVYRRVIDTGQAEIHEYPVTFERLGKRYFQDKITPYVGNSVLVISRDITIQKRIEEELRASEARYRSVVDDQTEFIARWKLDSTLTFVNEAACRFSGLSYEQLIGHSFHTIIQPADQTETSKLYHAVHSLTPENPTTEGQTLMLAPTGEQRWIQWTTRAIFDETQQIIEYQTVGSDITDLRRMEDKLRYSEARYRSVVEAQNELIARFTPDGFVTFVNEAAYHMFGSAAQEIIGHNILEHLNINDSEVTREAVTSTLNLTPKNPSLLRVLKIPGPNGQDMQIEFVTQAIFNDKGQAIEYQTTGRDVTALRQTEAALRESEARYRSVIEGQTELIVRFLPGGTITFVNDAICRYLSLTRQELIGRNALGFVYSEDQPTTVTRVRELALRPPSESIRSGENRVKLPNGEIRWIQWTTRVFYNDEKQVSEYQSVGRDITDLKQAQDTLEQQNELLRQLGDQLIDVQEIERQRIARDLHDSVLNELGAMLIAPPEMLTPKTVRDNYERLIEQLRQTINGLRSPMLNYGLYAALEDLYDRLMDTPQSEGIMSMEIPPSQARFDTNVELHLFRIIQQACENALQHAKAHHIRIYGQIDESQVEITVKDDGIGFLLDSETDLAHVLAQKHFGLVSMYERSKLIGAKVKLSTLPGAGTQVHVLWEPPESVRKVPESVRKVKKD